MRTTRRSTVCRWGGVSLALGLLAATLTFVAAPAQAQTAPDATILVRKAGDRTGIALGDDTTPLEGATFEAYAKGTSRNQNIPGGSPAATCTTDATGVCTLNVSSSSRRYLVVETGAPAGWSVIEEIALGAFNASGTNRAYRWNVGVTSGGTTLVPETEIINSSTQTWPQRPDPQGPLTVEDYRWANVRDNPLLDDTKCGLNIALIFDQSGSIGNNQGDVQAAAVEFVEQLTGTPTEIATFTFSTNSPQNSGGSRNRPELISIADRSGADQVISNINGLSNPGGGTNWDYALRQVANATPFYDLAFMLTDGNPTAWRGETSSTGDVDDYDVEEAVHSANWLKSLGTRIVSIGFSGQAGGLTATNLALISGPKEGVPANPQADDDYFLTTFGELADLLSRIALNSCGGTINVSKKISPTWNGIDAVALEPNWPFERPLVQPWIDPRTAQTEPDGNPAIFTVSFEQGQLERDVTIFEPDVGPNLPIREPGGKNARCTITGEQDPDSRVLNVPNDPFGVTVTGVKDTEIVSCLFVNSPLQLLAEKYEDLDLDGQKDPGDPPLNGWTIFIDDNGNSMLDPGEPSGETGSGDNPDGEFLFERLPGEGTYRVCEVLQPGFVNTDPGGGTLCKDQDAFFPTQPVDPIPPAGPVQFGNVPASSFTITKFLDSGTGFVPIDTEFTVEVECETSTGAQAPGFPQIFEVEDGDTVSVGPVFDGYTCTIEETDSKGADVTITPSEVTFPTDDGIEVDIDNAYPAGSAEIVKVVDGDLADRIPEGTEFGVEVTCTFPAGFPVQGPVPGYDPLELVVESGASGQPGVPVPVGPLPVGTQCDIVETDDNGATTVDIDPSNITIADSVDPIRVTITNTFDPAALRIVKEVAGAPVPEDTEFQADVECTFQNTTTFDERVSFGIGIDDAYLVDDQPVGAECTITEVPPPGDPDVVYDPGQTVTLEPPPDPVLIDVTITNTFEPGSLEISKVVDDSGSGLVPVGTQFVVNVDCVYAGNSVPGYPQDITFTNPGDLTETLTNIPAGAECTVREVASSGASDVTIEPPQPVTITPDPQDPAVEVTVTNVYDVGQFEVKKRVVDPSGLVPAGTPFKVDIRCSYPDGWPEAGEPIPGFDPKTLTITSGPPGQAGPPVPSGLLPIGSSCTIAENDSAGAASTVIVPETIVVGDPNGPTEVIVENTYPVGALELRKAVDDGGTGLIPVGTPYTLVVECSYPADYPPALAGNPIPGFDPLIVDVPSGPQGRPGASVRIGEGGLPVNNGGLPVGASCAITEPDTQGANDPPAIVPNPAIVTDDLRNPVEVVTTNVYPVGGGQVVKVTTGELADALAPPGTPFEVEVRCTYPLDYPPLLAGEPIPGFDPETLIISSGLPDQAGPPVAFGPLPLGSRCTVTESDDGGASDTTITPPQPITIDSETTPVEVTVTNEFAGAGLLISKEVDGPGGGLVPPQLEYTVRVECDQPTAGTFIAEVEIGVGSPEEVPGPGELALEEGSECVITELDSQGADFSLDPPNPILLDGNTDPVIVDVTVTNTFADGELTITKDVSGELAGLVPDGTEYRIGVACSIGGLNVIGYPTEVILTTPDQLSQTITGLPVGATCFASEADTVGAVSPPTFAPPSPDGFPFRSGDVEITENPQEPITITVFNRYPGARGQIVKVVDGPQAGVIQPDTEFVVAVTCTFPDNHPAAPGIVPGFDRAPIIVVSGGTPGSPGPPTVFGPVPPGSSCSFEETDDQGASGVAIEPNPVVVDTVNEPFVEVTVTNTFDEGGLRLTKVVDGDGASFVPPDTIYTVQVTCTLRGDPVLDETLQLVAGTPQTIDGLTVGTECTIVETDSQGADDVTIAPPSPVTIVAGTATVDVTIANTYRVGDFDIVKIVDGDLADLITPGTEFAVDVTCSYPTPFPVQGPIPNFDPLMTAVASGQPGQPGPPTEIGPLPVGSTCTIVETDERGASSVTIEPDEVVIPDPVDEPDPITVVVTNTFDSAALRIIKVLDGPGAPLLPPDTEFRARVVCMPPDGNPANGFDGEVTFGVDDPAIVAGQPVGSTCTVAETETNGATDVAYSPSRTVVLEGAAPVSVDVTITNSIGAGGLAVEKALAGGGAPFVPSETVFLVEVDCSFDGTRLGGFPRELQLASPDGSSSVDGLPLGSVCTVTETEPHGAQNVVITPAQPVTITGNTAVDVAVTNTFGVGGLVIDKVLTGPGASSANGPFDFQLACNFLGRPLDPQPVVPPIDLPSTSTTVSGIPIGATCTVQELSPFGGAIGPPSIVPSSVTIVAGGDVVFTVTNTFAPPPPLPDTGGNTPRQLLPIALAVVLFGLALWLTGQRLPGRRPGDVA